MVGLDLLDGRQDLPAQGRAGAGRGHVAGQVAGRDVGQGGVAGPDVGPRASPTAGAGVGRPPPTAPATARPTACALHRNPGRRWWPAGRAAAARPPPPPLRRARALTGRLQPSRPSRTRTSAVRSRPRPWSARTRTRTSLADSRSCCRGLTLDLGYPLAGGVPGGGHGGGPLPHRRRPVPAAQAADAARAGGGRPARSAGPFVAPAGPATDGWAAATGTSPRSYRAATSTARRPRGRRPGHPAPDLPGGHGQHPPATGPEQGHPAEQSPLRPVRSEGSRGPGTERGRTGLRARGGAEPPGG